MKPDLKVSRAVTKAAFSHPFWGSLMLSLGHQKREDIPTACTDGKRIYWSPKFIDELTEDQTLGLMAHEICHVIFQHCEPHGAPYDEDPKLCNIAMDYVINNTIMQDGFKLPEGGVIDTRREFVGMAWKQVFKILKDVKDKHEESEEGKEPDYEKGEAPNNGMSKERQKELGKEVSEMTQNPNIMDVIENSDLTEEEKQELKQKVVKAAQDAKAAGVGNLPGDLEGLIEEIRTSKVDWREYLISTLQNKYPEDYTFKRPNKKLMEATGIYLPSMEGVQVGNLAIGLDTSGSVSQDEMVDYLGEINQICREFSPERIYLFYCDYSMAKEEIYEQGEDIDILKTRGGGGTSFVPVFDHIERQGIQIDQLIYFSDMEVWEDCFPRNPPGYDVLWLSTRSDYDVPFGTLIKINS